ncbi:MAG: GDSL-type esterase/lipase family protein [Bacteroidales bacterium]
MQKRSFFLPLLASVFLYLLIACSPVLHYQKTPDVLAWEKDIRALEHLDSIETDPENAILFTGSSSIRLWNTIQEDMSPWKVIRRGYGGAKLSDFAVYASRIIYPHNPSAIVIFIANDVTGSPTDKTPHEIDALVKSIHRTIRAKFPSVPIFWIEITPTPSRWSAWPRIQKANRKIQSFCQHHKNTWFIQTSGAFLTPELQPRPELFINDQLHLNHEGYLLWSSIIKDNLQKVLSR